jgi:TonB family protein
MSRSGKGRDGSGGHVGVAVGIAAAVLVHAVILLFGGILFLHSGSDDPKKTKVENVELIQTDDAKKKEKEKKQAEEEAKKEESKDEKPEEIKEDEQVPDLQELAKLDAAAAAPALDAMSLSALEDALSGADMASGDGGFFQNSVDFSSGGRIGGTGKGTEVDEGGEGGAFAIAELDQRPRAILQTAPQYPYELRQKKIEGTVSVLFIVDETGRVVNPRIETSPNPGFERPVLEAVRQWRFEAAVRGGKKVAARMRVPLRFSAGS